MNYFLIPMSTTHEHMPGFFESLFNLQQNLINFLSLKGENSKYLLKNKSKIDRKNCQTKNYTRKLSKQSDCYFFATFFLVSQHVLLHAFFVSGLFSYQSRIYR